MIEHVKRFLQLHWDKKSPLLLGYSGGPDSKALLYALIKNGSYPIHIAHVDHGWREESRDEAADIEEEMKTLRLPFHSARLSGLKPKECEAREARLSFFSSLFEKIPFQALLLAHQAEDVAETSLKRIFEGAHLPFLGGMKQIGRIYEMEVWRPLLQKTKKEILSFLQEHSLKPFFDKTNQDPLYLRSRLREEIFPFLRKSFGKEIEENLYTLSERSFELQNYLTENTKEAIIRTFPEGKAISCKGFARIEQRYILQAQAKEVGMTWTRPVLEKVLDWVEDPRFMRHATLQSHWISSGRGWVVLLKGRPRPGFLRSVIDYKSKVCNNL